MKIIPAIDLRGGRCVRLLKGEFDRETRYSDEPAAVAHAYRSMGFDTLHVVDLDGARTGDQHHQAIVRRITAETGLAVQLGGGIRHRDTVAAWLDAGVSRLVVGSLAVQEPAAVAGWFDEFGPARFVLALDVRLDAGGIPRLATHGWTRDSKRSLWDCIDGYRSTTALEHVLCTDVGRDGAMTGPNVDLYREFVARCPDIALQASGGVRDAADLEALRDLGAAAAITGRALLDGAITEEEIRTFLRDG